MPTFDMFSPTPGTTYHCPTSGNAYTAGPSNFISGVEAKDIGEMQRVGCVIAAPVSVVNCEPGSEITVSAGTVLNQRIGYKDNTLGAEADNITLTADGCTIDGDTSLALTVNGQYFELIWDGVSNWRIA